MKSPLFAATENNYFEKRTSDVARKVKEISDISWVTHVYQDGDKIKIVYLSNHGDKSKFFNVLLDNL